MKLRVLVLALASASSVLPTSAQAADDFCSRLIVQAVSQFCQLLPNGWNLCQPVALVGPNPECATPERQALAPVPLGPPTLQPPAPWGSPYASGSWPASPATYPWAGMPFPLQGVAVAPATAPTPPTLPRIMPAAPKPSAAALPSAPQPPVAPVVARPAAAAVTPPAAPPAAVIAPVASPVPRTTTTPTALAAEPAAAATVAVATPVTTPPASAPRAEPAAAVGAASAAAEEAADALTHFEFDSATLTDAGRAVLDAWVAHAPKDKPVRLSGHADRLGPEPYNLNLSLRRAEAVKQYLVGKGVSPRRIQLEAKGEAEPVKRCRGGATPATKACLAPNRRVEIDPE